MAIEPENKIEPVTKSWLESHSAYTTTPQKIDLLLPEFPPNTLLLEIQNPNEESRHYWVSRSLFLNWMRDKVRQLESVSS